MNGDLYHYHSSIASTASSPGYPLVLAPTQWSTLGESSLRLFHMQRDRGGMQLQRGRGTTGRRGGC